MEQPIDESILVLPFCIHFPTCVQATHCEGLHVKWPPSAVKNIKCENAVNVGLTHKWHLHFGNSFTFCSSVFTFTVNVN